MTRTLLVFGLLYLTCLVRCNDGDNSVYILEHDLGEAEFSQRGKIRLPSVRHKEPEILSQGELESSEIDVLDAQGARSNGIYRLRVRREKDKDFDNSTMIMGYAYSQHLLSAGLNDVVTVFSDETGNIISVSIRPQKNAEPDDNTAFNTLLLTETPAQGPVPDTAGYLNKVREEKIKKEKADKEPKSFFGKYWMYILPIVLFMMLSNANQQQQQG